jgi:hypothetical protein
MKKIALVALVGVVAISGSAFALKDWSHQKTPVEFYTGHSHNEDGITHGAPQHSGGTNAMGCHNGSVPYHCH